MTELKPCPFCGGDMSVVILDDEGNIRDEEYERDPYSGLSYVMAHNDPNGACPIVTYDEPILWLYDSRDDVAHVWNRRAERTCQFFYDEKMDEYACSACGERVSGSNPADEYEVSPLAVLESFKFCPRCGAKVVGE